MFSLQKTTRNNFKRLDLPGILQRYAVCCTVVTLPCHRTPKCPPLVSLTRFQRKPVLEYFHINTLVDVWWLTDCQTAFLNLAPLHALTLFKKEKAPHILIYNGSELSMDLPRKVRAVRLWHNSPRFNGIWCVSPTL